MTRSTIAAATLLIVGLAGCHHASHRTSSDDPTRTVESGGGGRVSGRQAADVQFALGRSLEEGNQLVEAEAAYRQALENDPRRADAHARLAVLCDERGDFEAATTHFAKAIRRLPRNPDLLCDRGYHAYVQKRYREAEDDLRKAIAIDPGHRRAHGNLALVLAHRGDVDAALAEFASAGCKPAEAKANLGLILAMEGRTPDAERAYADALAADPGLAPALAGRRALAATAPESLRHTASRPDDSVVRASANAPQSP